MGWYKKLQRYTTFGMPTKAFRSGVIWNSIEIPQQNVINLFGAAFYAFFKYSK